jgi:tRNA 2-thiouridine synthesizing protein A
MTNDAAGTSAALTVDARGMRCPWPALRLARAMRAAQDVVLIADDPNAAREVAALAAEQGWRIDDAGPMGDAARWRVRRD